MDRQAAAGRGARGLRRDVRAVGQHRVHRRGTCHFRRSECAAPRNGRRPRLHRAGCPRALPGCRGSAGRDRWPAPRAPAQLRERRGRHRRARVVCHPRNIVQEHGLLAACAFALTAPVVFVGALATPDAVCLAFLAVAAGTAMAARSLTTAAVTGLLLAAAVAVAYVAALFVPVVLLAILFARTGGSAPRSAESPPARLGIALAVAIGSFAALQLLAGDEVRKGLAVTFRSLGAPGTGALWGAAVLDIGLLVMAAVGRHRRGRAHGRAGSRGVRAPPPRGPRSAARPPAERRRDVLRPAQRLRGAVPRADGGVRARRPVPADVPRDPRPRGPGARAGPVFSRSEALFHQWSDVGVVMADIEAHPQPGTYLSVASDAFAYHARAIADVRWEATSAFYARGLPRCAGPWRSGAPGHRVADGEHGRPRPGRSAPRVDAQRGLRRDPLAQPTDHVRDEWLVYRLVNTLP